MATFALAYFYTNDPKYAERATKLADRWFVDPATSLRPHANNSCVSRFYDSGERQFCVLEMRDLTWALDARSGVLGTCHSRARASTHEQQ